MPLITSSSNPRISTIKNLHTTRGRKRSGHFLMEGPNLLETVLDAQVLPHEVYYQPELLQRTSKGRLLLNRLIHLPALSQNQLIEVSTRVIEAISDVNTSQGLVSILSLNTFTSERARTRRTQFTHSQSQSSVPSKLQRPVLLILDDLADPGNMGTILRTALAADVDTVLLTPNCVDCYSPKVVRAAAGAHVMLPIESDVSWSTIEEKVKTHCQHKSEVLLAEARGTSLYDELDLRLPFALIIGNEAHGPSPEARALATKSISIPLANGVESLNAAMAAGILLYESVRQNVS